MAAQNHDADVPDGIFSLLDTDLYKLTMQCCILKYFPDVHVTYSFTNRTPHMKLNRASSDWLQEQISKLENVSLSNSELEFLKEKCSYLSPSYLEYLTTFSFKPSEQVKVEFQADTPASDAGSPVSEFGSVYVGIKGLWLETILYEIPVLALLSEAYFKFCDRDWNHDNQTEKAKTKGLELLKLGCVFSEFGTRRRRDYHTQEMVIDGLIQAKNEAAEAGLDGKLTGTSNVHLAHKYGLQPIGTVAHEWFMGIAAITDDYENANEIALKYWVGTFGEGVLGIALTDTFGTSTFLRAFKKPIPSTFPASHGSAIAIPPADSTSQKSSVDDSSLPSDSAAHSIRTYAHAFGGVRQDSGDPEAFVTQIRDFYDSLSIHSPKSVVFSDSLNTALCAKYKRAADAVGLAPSFGVGTFFTNDFQALSTGEKSVPLNIVIKLASAGGRPAVKISDNVGKNTGDKKTVEEVKRRLGYVEAEWKDGDESKRWT